MDEKEKEAALDKPFGEDPTPAGDVKPEEKVEEKAEEEVEVEKPRVPYSRLENVIRARREAEEEAAKWRERALELEESRFTQPKQTGDVPAYWLRLYGDTPEAREGWRLKQENEPTLTAQQIREEAVAAYREEQKREQKDYQTNLMSLDDRLDTLSEFVGRQLTEQEQSDILDLADKMTAKDEAGNYIGELPPFDALWDIHELQQKQGGAPRRQSRDRASQAISAVSDGQPNVSSEEDKNWKPGWYNWEKRLPRET